MKMYKDTSKGGVVKTNSKTEKTFTDPEKLVTCGNDGNTYSTKLPGHGAPRGSKKMGKRRKGY